jgi:cytochrome c556
VAAGLLAALTGGCAATTTPRIGSGDVVADRQRLMKLNGASWQDAQNKFKAGQIEAIAVNAETMAVNAQHIPALFPQGSLTDKSKAKPEIWQKWAEFEASAKNMVAWAERLRDAARAKDAGRVEAIMKDFGRQACGSCHTPFRVPPPRQS